MTLLIASAEAAENIVFHASEGSPLVQKSGGGEREHRLAFAEISSSSSSGGAIGALGSLPSSAQKRVDERVCREGGWVDRVALRGGLRVTNATASPPVLRAALFLTWGVSAASPAASPAAFGQREASRHCPSLF